MFICKSKSSAMTSVNETKEKCYHDMPVEKVEEINTFARRGMTLEGRIIWDKVLSVQIEHI